MTQKLEHQLIRKCVKRFSFYELDDETPAKAAEIFEELRQQFEGRNVTLNYYHDDATSYLKVLETRLETDAERDYRLEQEQVTLNWKRRQLENLKRELGET